MPNKLLLWQRIARAALSVLLTAVLLAAFYLAVIMGNPQSEESTGVTVNMDQPLLTALPASVLIRDQGQLNELLSRFPAPVMAAMNPAGMTFEQGLCQDVPFEGGIGRTVILSYRTAEGSEVTVMSIYPARALSLVKKGDYTLSAAPGLTLATLRSVRMENGRTVRMHAQGPEALYVVTLPARPTDTLRSFTSTLQLYQGD